VHGQVAHPLQVGDHPERGHQHPQVARHRLLGGQQLERPLLELVAEGVDLAVVGDDPFGRLSVGVQQCRGGALDGFAHRPGHRHEVGDDAVELVVIEVTHAAHRSQPGAPHHSGAMNAG
jgi:hypothetical protein